MHVLNIMSKVLEQIVITIKMTVFDNSAVIWCPSPRNSSEYLHMLYFQKLESSSYMLLLIMWVYFHSSVLVGF